MLVNQMLVTLFLGIGDFDVPSTFLHDSFGSENGFFKAIMTIKMGGVFNQVGIVDVPPPIPITDTWDVPSGVVNCASN